MFGVWEGKTATTRAQSRKAEDALHVEQLRQRRKAERLRSLQAKLPRGFERMQRLLEALESDQFCEWYEATTGQSALPFIEKCCQILQDELENAAIHVDYGWRGNPCIDASTVERLVRNAVARYPYSNPETRGAWAKALDGLRGRARRVVLLRIATPRWADKKAIASVYCDAALKSAETGVKHHVDHIIPIVHEMVCGLHCEANMRVIPWDENLSKSNRFHPGGSHD